MLEAHHAVIRGTHVVYTSGKHGDAYVNKDALYTDPTAVSKLCGAIADHFASKAVEVVAAPALGGVALSQWTAHHLIQKGAAVLAVYAEKQPDSSFAFRRGYDAIVRQRRVLIVEDVLTTGGSVKAVIAAVRSAGGEVVGVGAICNRGTLTREDLEVPDFFALANVSLQAWDAGSCPLCEARVPINLNVGKGREFIAASPTDRAPTRSSGRG